MRTRRDKPRLSALAYGLGLTMLLGVSPERPAYAEGEGISQCVRNYPDDDAGRLRCFDELSSPLTMRERSYLTRVWNLDDMSNLDPSKLGRLHPYRQNYLIVRKTNSPNRQPSSPLADHTVTVPIDLDAAEAKFQLSVKADIGDKSDVNFLGIKSVRFWGAYTQQSFWQVFNLRNSSPFRETVYEPELIVTLGTGRPSGLKLVNLGWLHQSNGSPLPSSRSWNRIYLLGGWEWNNMTSILLRGWWRIPEDPAKDDNPDISDYLGRADLVVRWEPGDKSQSVAVLLRNNLRLKKNLGYAQIDWATAVRFGSAARMHIQLTSGYGESLIDYNHRQTTLGIGFSFREW